MSAAAPRLINRSDVLTQLLAAIAAVPAGVKLSIPQLRDALVSQADVLRGLEMLIGAGELEPGTLRPPPEPPAPPVAKSDQAGPGKGREAGNVPASALVPEIDRFLERSGMPKTKFSAAVLGGKTAYYRLLKPGVTVEARTAERVRALIAKHDAAASPPVAMEPPPPAKAPPPPESLSGADLAAEIDAFLVRTGAGKGRVSNLLFDNGTGIDRLRRAKSVRPETIAKVRQFIAMPPHDLLAPRYARRSTPARSDPTQKPADPELEVADRTRLKAVRKGAEIRRGQEKKATALVDAGVDPGSVKSNADANLMRQILRRRADEARLADPLEQAKLTLQRKGRTVYCAAVTGGAADRFVVSGAHRPVKADELIALAAGAMSFARLNERGAR